MGITRETLAELVVHVLADPRSTDKHVEFLRSATTAEEWVTAEQIVEFGERLRAHA